MERISIGSLSSCGNRVSSFMDTEGSEECHQQKIDHAKFSVSNGTIAQNEQVVAGGNYRTLPLVRLVYSPCQPTTGNGVDSCSQVEGSYSEGVGVKVNRGEQEATLDTVECEVTTPELNTCVTAQRPVLTDYVTLDSAPAVRQHGMTAVQL